MIVVVRRQPVDNGDAGLRLAASCSGCRRDVAGGGPWRTRPPLREPDERCLALPVRNQPCVEVLTRAELLDRVGGRRAVDRVLACGSWVRVMRGAFVPTGTVLDLSVRARAAQRLLPDSAHVADRCLLWLMGVDVLPPGPPQLEVVVPPGSVTPRRAGLLARQAVVPPGDSGALRGVRCLRPARAVVDLLRLLPLVEAVVVADAVQRAGLCRARELTLELPAHAGLRGVRGVNRVLQLADPRAESPPESRLRVHLVLAGLEPLAQYDVLTPDGRWLARVDLAFPDLRLALEYDGREVHERGDVFYRDRARQNALVAAGWTVLRFTAADLRHPQRLVLLVQTTVRWAA